MDDHFRDLTKMLQLSSTSYILSREMKEKGQELVDF